MFLSTRACLPFACQFFSAPKYFQTPATQALFTETMFFNLVPRALFPGFGGGLSPTSKAREKCPGNKVGCCRQQSSAIDSIVFLQFSTANAIYTKSFDKTFVKSKVVEFIDAVNLRCLADRCYFCVSNQPEPASRLSIYGYRKDPRAGNVEGSSKSPQGYRKGRDCNDP